MHFQVVHHSNFMKQPVIAQLAERETVVVAEISRSVVQIRLTGNFNIRLFVIHSTIKVKIFDQKCIITF